MNSKNILGVKIDEITEYQATELVSEWLKSSEKKYIVTPNIEFIMHAQHDEKFKKTINAADLSIPDSARFNWAITELESKHMIKKLILWPLFFFPKSGLLKKFPVTAGTDLMDALIKEANEKKWSIGLLGGKDEVAKTLKLKLERKYPALEITYANPGGVIDNNGNVLWTEPSVNPTEVEGSLDDARDDNKIKLPKTDLLFVAFGHGKQEKWIVRNREKQPVKVMMGVGGAFDYLSGSIPRAPKAWQKYGFEWLYRLIQQPWRAKRFLSLITFTFLILNTKSKS